MIAKVDEPVLDATAAQELFPDLDGGNGNGAGMWRLVHSFRHSMVLAFLGSTFLPPLAYISSPAEDSVIPSPGEFYLKLGLYGVAALAAIVGLYLLLRKLEPHILKESLDQAAFLENIPDRFLSLAIAGSASLSLLLELAVIRWQGTIFEFFAFYKNYGLLACFAGLGLGYALSRSKGGIPLILTLPLLAWQFGLLIALRWGLPQRPYSLETIPFREQLNMGLTATWDQIGVVYLLLTVVFLLTALAFIPVGQLCGKLMERKGQLPAYGFNLLGSLAGVLLMFLVSFLWTPPVVWFGLCFVISLFFFVRKPSTLLLAMGFTTIALTSLAWPVNPMWNKVYSPYQSLDIGYGPNGLMLIRAAGHYYQRVHNLSDAAVAATSDLKLRTTRDYYDFPYRVRPRANAVAVVGAGSGNDVAAALRSGAQHVDAIEIDPAILLAGETNHPERPYGDPRVRPIVNDARSFLRTTESHYDLIVYGLLDSHTLLSQASSVRLDSFVYTVEGLREARSRLKANGVLSLSFSVLNNALGTKIYQMMKQAFDGKEPLCFFPSYDGAQVFMQSKNGDLSIPQAVLSNAHVEERPDFYRDSTIKVDVSTDDWPFLYMPRRVYPLSYLVVLGLILLLTFALYASFFREQPKVSHLPFFFLGAGFMLVETKAITEMGLTFGNTWQVIAIAIASILIMAFLANGIVHRLRLSGTFSLYFLLFASLAVGWWIAISGGLSSTIIGRIGTAAILTCPLFFSGIIFSTLLSAESRISSAMSMNLMGAMCGGILEYNSMHFGFHFLYLLALGLYAAALLSGFAFRSKHVLSTLRA
jgi:spermidine synthase